MRDVAITDVCDFQGGTQPPKSEWSTTEQPGYIRMLQIRDFTQPNEKYIEYVRNKSSLKTCTEKDILIGRYGASIGKILTGLSGAYNVAMVKTIPNTEVLDSDFLLHLLKSSSFQNFILNIGSRAAQAGFNRKELAKYRFPLPPLAEQKQIAAILDAADSLRQKNQQLVEHYTALSQSLFLEMFGDPVSNPMEWEKKILSDFIENLNTGVSVNSGDEKYSQEKFGILKTSCVYSGEFRPEEAKVIRSDEFERMKLNPQADSIIISRMNTTELVGKSSYIDQDYPNLFLPDRLWQSEKSNLDHNVRWLAKAISFDSFMNEIGKISSGTSGSMKNISKKNFLNLPLIYPPADLQNQFAERIAVIEQQKQQAQTNLQKSEALFNSLLQRAFTGELTADKAA